VGLEQATTESNAKPGDRVHVRRDGVEQVTKEIKVIGAANGQMQVERRQVPRNRWRVTAENFRMADRQTAGRDPALVAAQSQMVLIEKALERVFPNDVRARRGIMEVAKERIAQHLEQGHSFAQARVKEPGQDLDRSERNKGEVRQNRNGGRVRIQQRER